MNRQLTTQNNINDKLGISTVLNGISQVYERLNNIDKTIEYLNKSLAIATELDDELVKGMAISPIKAWNETFTANHHYKEDSLKNEINKIGNDKVNIKR